MAPATSEHTGRGLQTLRRPPRGLGLGEPQGVGYRARSGERPVPSFLVVCSPGPSSQPKGVVGGSALGLWLQGWAFRSGWGTWPVDHHGPSKPCAWPWPLASPQPRGACGGLSARLLMGKAVGPHSCQLPLPTDWRSGLAPKGSPGCVTLLSCVGARSPAAHSEQGAPSLRHRSLRCMSHTVS